MDSVKIPENSYVRRLTLSIKTCHVLMCNNFELLVTQPNVAICHCNNLILLFGTIQKKLRSFCYKLCIVIYVVAIAAYQLRKKADLGSNYIRSIRSYHKMILYLQIYYRQKISQRIKNRKHIHIYRFAFFY